ncbi:GNAT family N-acetyltransferase [Sphingomonas sp. ID0503]|uniref:GNAT family N-acetyltransferase n=1 Tax=Sphingomonas sp. ID0503 TaxID=3399691 RepID=UPI003AFB591D
MITLRPAREHEIPALNDLIARSARGLSTGDYSPGEIEALITHIFGVDSELVSDGTYVIAEVDGEVAGCGGWSRRRTLFGGDAFAGRESGFLDPATDAAKIRAFFVAPEFARRGVGQAILDHCAAAAAGAGFSRLELMATLPGVPFYRRLGFDGEAEVVVEAGETPVRFVPMERSVS